MRHLRALVLAVPILIMWSQGSASAEKLLANEFMVETPDGVSIAVHHKARDGGVKKGPVLLVHGTWTSAAVWDLPGRSFMDYFAQRGFDVYALDLRGMGDSDKPDNFWTIGYANRITDLATVAGYIYMTTGKPPVVVGWSQGGCLAAMLAGYVPSLVSGVALLGVPSNGYYASQETINLLLYLISVGLDRFVPPPEALFGMVFGFNPATGAPTVNFGTFGDYYATAEPDSLEVILEQGIPEYFQMIVAPAYPMIQAPTLVVAAGLDYLVSVDSAQQAYEMIGSADKELVILEDNAHGFFMEDNYQDTLPILHEFFEQL